MNQRPETGNGVREENETRPDRERTMPIRRDKREMRGAKINQEENKRSRWERKSRRIKKRPARYFRRMLTGEKEARMGRWC